MPNLSRAWVIAAVLSLAGCFTLYPGPSDDYDLGFAKTYYRSRSSASAPTALSLTLDQLYAVHRYGLSKHHPATSMNAEFARRGAAAAPFLKTKLEQQQSFGQVASIFEALSAMQQGGGFDVRTDPAFIALIERATRAYPSDPDFTLRNMADELETGTRIPTWFQPYYREARLGGLAHDKLGSDYDVEFARRYCRRCSYRDYIAGLDARPIDQLYALQRFAAETEILPKNIDHIVARRGAAAIAFFKSKLAGPGSDIMVWNILSTIEMMQALGTYDAASDAELMQLAKASVSRVAPGPGPLVAQLERLRTGQIMRQAGRAGLPWMGS